MANIKSFLNRRFANIPVWVWAILAAILLYLAYRYFRGRSSGGSSGGTAASTNAADTTGGAGDAQSPGSSTSPVDTSGSVGSLSEGQLISDLASALQDQMPQGDTTTGDRTPNPDVPIGSLGSPEKPLSGGGIPKPKAPPPPKNQPPTKPKKQTPPPKKQPTNPPVRYYTYKKDVPLRKGQTVHYKTGKGYYAA